MIDVDDPSTWPIELRSWAQGFADELRDKGHEYAGDLPVPYLRDVTGLPGITRDTKFVAYHNTRLLDYEEAAIRRRGLLRLSEELVRERIDKAHAHAVLSDAEREHMRLTNTFAIGESENREGQVCFVLGRRGLNGSAAPLLASWGGEGIYMNGRPRDRPSHGRPAIVVARVDLRNRDRRTLLWPSLSNVLVGVLLGLDNANADVHLYDDVAAADIIDVWHPGRPEYDRCPPTTRLLDRVSQASVYRHR